MSVDEAAAVALIVGFAVVAALAGGFAEVLEDVLAGEGVAVIDQPASTWLATHRDLWLTTALRVITVAGCVVALGVLAAVISALVAWRRRSWLPLVLGVVASSTATPSRRVTPPAAPRSRCCARGCWPVG